MFMRTTFCFLAVAAMFASSAATVWADDAPAKSKPNAARLKGMKAAVADIEKGLLKEKHANYPDAPQFGEYIKSLEKYGVVVERVDNKSKAQRDETEGYNDVMRVEIEHRFGDGLVRKLWKKAFKGADPKAPQKPAAKPTP